MAHYLIQTRRTQTTQELPDAKNQVSAKNDLSFDNAESKSIGQGSFDSDELPETLLKLKSVVDEDKEFGDTEK